MHDDPRHRAGQVLGVIALVQMAWSDSSHSDSAVLQELIPG